MTGITSQLTAEDVILICAASYASLWVVAGYLWFDRNPPIAGPPMDPELFASLLYWHLIENCWTAGIERAGAAMKVRVVRGPLVAVNLGVLPPSPSDPRLRVTYRPAPTTLLLVVPVGSLLLGTLIGSVFGFLVFLLGLTVALGLTMAAALSSLGFAAKELIPLVRVAMDPRTPLPASAARQGMKAFEGTRGLSPSGFPGPPRDPMEAWAREQNIRNATQPYPGPQTGPPRPPPP